MSSRTYAQIECSLKSSKKLRGLANHGTRWAYICAHLSDYCTYTGLFRYPLPMWAHDAQMDVPELENAITEMVEAGLIDYDPEEQIIRIVGWFHKRSGPDNPNRVDGVIADLCSLDNVEDAMLCKAVSELAVASVKRSLRWRADAPGRTQLYGSLKGFLAEVFQDHGDNFLELLNTELSNAPTSVSVELKAIFPVLNVLSMKSEGKGSERVTPTLREHETRRDVDETKTKKDLDETSLSNFSETASQQRPAREVRPEVLRKSDGPTLSAINSTIAQSVRKSA